MEEEEREKYEKAIEERKKLLHNPTVSVQELKHHWHEYKQQMIIKKHENDLKRLEERKKTKEVSEWLQQNIKKTKFHQLVETEASP